MNGYGQTLSYPTQQIHYDKMSWLRPSIRFYDILAARVLCIDINQAPTKSQSDLNALLFCILKVQTKNVYQTQILCCHDNIMLST